MIRKTIASLLALSMVLGMTACSASSSEGAAESTPEAPAQESGETAEEESVPSEVPEEARKDVINYLTDGIYSSGDEVLKVGETSVTADEILYQVAYQYYQASYYYYQYGQTFDVTGTAEDGTSYADLLLDYGLDSACANAMGMEKAREKGLTLSEEEAASLTDYYDKRVKAYGEYQWNQAVESGTVKEEDYSEEEKAAWITETGTQFYTSDLLYLSNTRNGDAASYEKYLYTTKLESFLFDEGGEYALSGQQLDEQVQDYIDTNGVLWGRCILFPKEDSTAAGQEGEETAGEEKAEGPSPEDMARETYEELSALEGDALREAFTEKQTEFDKSGYTAGEIQKYTSSDSLVEGYYSGLQALKAGEVGITEETDYGWFVLLREEDDPESLKETVSQDFRTKTFSSLFTQWMEEYGIDYDAIMTDLDVQAYFQKLTALQQIIQAGQSQDTQETLEMQETAE